MLSFGHVATVARGVVAHHVRLAGPALVSIDIVR